MSPRLSHAVSGTTLCLALLATTLSGSAVSAVGNDQPIATLNGHSIPLRDVANHHCHDRDYPEISCFETEKELEVDLGDAPTARSGAGSLTSQSYVQFFDDENYGGSSYTAYLPIPDLGPMGWNDAITSFKSLHGARPRFWQDDLYGNLSWRWAAGAWVANVGAVANDVFSSLKNVP